jgi:hypothetical protein
MPAQIIGPDWLNDFNLDSKSRKGSVDVLVIDHVEKGADRKLRCAAWALTSLTTREPAEVI